MGVPAAAMMSTVSVSGSTWTTGLSRSVPLRQFHGGRQSSTTLPIPVACVAARSSGNAIAESNEKKNGESMPCAMNRRDALALSGLAAALSLLPSSCDRGTANAAALPEEEQARLCDKNCEKDLDGIPTQTTSSGLQYKDIVVGTGPAPPKGFQVAADYVAMIPTGKVFDSSLEKGQPYIFRVGSDQVIKGLDEGILGMKVGGKRRLYIPGELAFPKGLSAAAGRPRVPPASPVIFDVDLLYVPGLEEDAEEEAPNESPTSKTDSDLRAELAAKS